jgi:hypothetical protein
MALVRIECEPRIASRINVGGLAATSILLGRLIDSGRQREVCFDADANFVVLEVGKRGSGKSFGMGAALESFATAEDNCSIANHGGQRRGVLLLDPLDVHWTAIYPLTSNGSAEMSQQYRLLRNWPEVKVDAVNVDVYMPAGKRNADDPPVFLDYFIPVTDLLPEDLALLYGANLVSDPPGMLIGEIYDKVTRTGYMVNQGQVQPKRLFGIRDLINCTLDDDIQATYQQMTIRAVRQRFLAWLRDPLFQRETGTAVTDLVRPGRLSILCLNRLSEDMRAVLTAVIVRKIKHERAEASQRERRRAFDPSAALPSESEMPRTILAIDEAQMILPVTGGGHARAAIESYVLEGRNFGLSIWLATQRPKGAISERAKSQLDTLIVHKLSTTEDIDAIAGLLQSSEPSSIKVNDRRVEVSDLIRSLNTGMALISSADADASRAFVAELRPRVVAHGGRAF